MKRRIFEVVFHYTDGSKQGYFIMAEDDIEAKEKAEKLDAKRWEKIEPEDIPDIEFCEIKLSLKVDA